jgi:tetratricopeptide (TPR) repeat protein
VEQEPAQGFETRSGPRAPVPDSRLLTHGPRPLVLFGIVAAITFLIYVPTLTYDFVWDDNRLVKNNSYLEQTNPTEIFTEGFAYNPGIPSEEPITYYRPLTILSFFLERKEWNLSPAGYHLTNIVLHGLAVFLVCLLLFRLFGSAPGAAVAGLFFGASPAVNSAVCWISGRNYLLALVLMLVVAWLMLQDLKAKPLFTSLLGTCLLLALLAHDAAVMLVPLVLFWVVLDRRLFRPVVSWVIAVLLVFAGYLLLRLAIARMPFPAGIVSDALHQPLLLLNAYGQQVLHLLAPFGRHVFYLPGPLAGFSAYTALGALFLVLPVGLAAALRSGPAALGAAWLILFLLPSGSAMLLGPAGRTLYLAAPGVLMLFLAAWTRLQVRARSVANWLLILGAGYAAACGVQTLRRNPVWHNELTLFSTITQETPEAVGAHLNFGNALLAVGRTDEAAEQYRAAIGLKPDYPDPRNKLAFLLLERNDLPGAIEQFRAVVLLEPASAEARNNLALTLKKDGQLDSAIAEYQASLRIEPSSETTMVNLGSAFLAQGDYASAIRVFDDALRRMPLFGAARDGLERAERAAEKIGVRGQGLGVGRCRKTRSASASSGFSAGRCGRRPR